MTDQLRAAVQRRQANIDAARKAAEQIDEERRERIAVERAVPKTTGTPLAEAAAPEEETTS